MGVSEWAVSGGKFHPFPLQSGNTNADAMLFGFLSRCKLVTGAEHSGERETAL